MAADTPLPPPSDAPVLEVADSISLVGGAISAREFLLTVMIMVFGLLVVGIQFLLLKSQPLQRTDEVTRPITVTLIIIGTLVLISSGFDNDQIAPAVGLFGTIAGYLLGRIQQSPKQNAAEARKDESHE